MKYAKYIFILLLGIMVSLPINVNALTYLPDPTEVYDGLPAAIMYDEFYSYNLWLLDELATKGPIDLEGSDSFTSNAGVGGRISSCTHKLVEPAIRVLVRIITLILRTRSAQIPAMLMVIILMAFGAKMIRIMTV